MGNSERGFTLLEVLIALTILSASLAVFYQSFGLNARLDHTAEKTAMAAIFADSKMALLGVAEHLEPGSESGDEGGGMTWSLDREPVGIRDDQPPKRYLTYAVTLTVYFDRREIFKTTSLRQDVR
jgi:type II secretion system protein I